MTKLEVDLQKKTKQKSCRDNLCICSNKLNIYVPHILNFQILVPEYNLELWPGYQTSIGQYEYAILMQAEINFKVLRTDTAYKMFRDYLDKSGPANVRVRCEEI